MSKQELPDWERVLSAAARLQGLLPDAVLVGGTAAVTHAGHRLSSDADHVLPDLRGRFEEILKSLESVAGWETARVNRPVQILGSLDGIETGIRQLIRKEPLETTTLEFKGQRITVPTIGEMLRIKASLILKRNATRDYLDFVALSHQHGEADTVVALIKLDELYPQPNGESALQQLQIQLSNPLPFDLEEAKLGEYKELKPPWQDWSHVRESCQKTAIVLFEALSKPNPE